MKKIDFSREEAMLLNLGRMDCGISYIHNSRDVFRTIILVMIQGLYSSPPSNSQPSSHKRKAYPPFQIFSFALWILVTNSLDTFDVETLLTNVADDYIFDNIGPPISPVYIQQINNHIFSLVTHKRKREADED